MSDDALTAYEEAAAARERQGIAPPVLTAAATAALCARLARASATAGAVDAELLAHRVPPGVDPAAAVKAEFLAGVAAGSRACAALTRAAAVTMLGRMYGGYSVTALVKLLAAPATATAAAQALRSNLLVYRAFDDVVALYRQGSAAAADLLRSWAQGEWLRARPAMPARVTLTVFKVAGEVNTDDLSPAPDAWSRPDIPLHAQSMFKMPRPGLTPDEPGRVGPLRRIAALKAAGRPLLFAADVVGTGSSRKSAANSLLWHIGVDLPYIPNKRGGGYVVGGKIAPIFYTTLEDAGALPLECEVTGLTDGASVVLDLAAGRITSDADGRELCRFTPPGERLRTEIRAGGRLQFIIGRDLTARAAACLHLPAPDWCAPPAPAVQSGGGFTRAQKIVGRACGRDGLLPGEIGEPLVTTVGSQDTTGPMTRDELCDLACLHFGAPLVMQSFCHTAAYPKPVDVRTHRTLPDFFRSRGGVALRPGDGVIHSWLNRMCLPDTVGTGGDSHTRMPLGISFAAGSGLVAFAAVAGHMPLTMPESVLVRLHGERRPGITGRDVVHGIAYAAQRRGLLTVAKQGKKNVFSGKILEIEGAEALTVEQAFELADASAERSAAACAVRLDASRVAAYLRSNAVLLRRMADAGYEDAAALRARAAAMDAWLRDPQLLEADPRAAYACVIDVDLATIAEPLLCAPDDPDDVRPLSAVQGTKVDEVFIGSCMTNIGHYRAAAALWEAQSGEVPVRLWLAPPTRMDREQLTHEGLMAVFGRVGARVEIPGCSLCMGNQARVRPGATVLSTSTRNFPNRLGDGARVFLGSAELAAVTAALGRLPTPAEYAAATAPLQSQGARLYAPLDFAAG